MKFGFNSLKYTADIFKQAAYFFVFCNLKAVQKA